MGSRPWARLNVSWVRPTQSHLGYVPARGEIAPICPLSWLRPWASVHRRRSGSHLYSLAVRNDFLRAFREETTVRDTPKCGRCTEKNAPGFWSTVTGTPATRGGQNGEKRVWSRAVTFGRRRRVDRQGSRTARSFRRAAPPTGVGGSDRRYGTSVTRRAFRRCRWSAVNGEVCVRRGRFSFEFRSPCGPQ